MKISNRRLILFLLSAVLCSPFLTIAMARAREELREANNFIIGINVMRLNQVLQDIANGQVPAAPRVFAAVDLSRLDALLEENAENNGLVEFRYLHMERIQQLMNLDRELTYDDILSCIDVARLLDDLQAQVAPAFQGFLRDLMKDLANYILRYVLKKLKEIGNNPPVNPPPPYQENENGNVGGNFPNPPGGDLDLALKIAAEAAGVKLQEERLDQQQKEKSDKNLAFAVHLVQEDDEARRELQQRQDAQLAQRIQQNEIEESSRDNQSPSSSLMLKMVDTQNFQHPVNNNNHSYNNNQPQRAKTTGKDDYERILTIIRGASKREQT